MKATPKPGNVLIAEPFLADPNFERSVVLICENDDNGSFGLVLNHESQYTFSELVNHSSIDFPVFIGGPVERNQLHYIHRAGHLIPDSIDLGNGIFWSGHFEEINDLIKRGIIGKNDIRFYVGYSGWAEGQLEDEIEQKSWVIGDITQSDIFENQAENIWKKILKNMGGDYKIMADCPIDPRLN